MKIHILMENTTLKEELVAEHGLSILIEHDNYRILLDAGKTEAFMDNALLMGLNLSDVEYAVLSHGHYDHSGGLGAWHRANPNRKIYAMRGYDGEYYSASRGELHEIGVPKEVLTQCSGSVVQVDGMKQLDKNVYMLGHSHGRLTDIGERAKLYVKRNGELEPDDFAHEGSLVIRTDRGLAVFNSCSHAGICNILDDVEDAFPGEKVYAFVGGLHMMSFAKGVEGCIYSKEEVAAMAERVKASGVRAIYTGHCTGSVAVGMLKDELGDIVHAISTGMSPEI